MLTQLEEFVFGDAGTNTIVEFIRAHSGWGVPLIFMLAFAESLAFVSLLIPATVILIAVGFVIGETGISFLPIWLSAVAGAFLGDWISYWVGARLKFRVGEYWPLSRHPDLLPRGHRFFERWGFPGVFVGRFFGPLRASIPLVAGICSMPFVSFQIANITSAMAWAAAVLAPGAFGMNWLRTWL